MFKNRLTYTLITLEKLSFIISVVVEDLNVHFYVYYSSVILVHVETYSFHLCFHHRILVLVCISLGQGSHFNAPGFFGGSLVCKSVGDFVNK